MYTDDLKYYQFMIEQCTESEKINGLVQTIIGESNGMSDHKLYSINEGVGDKIRNAWDKFMAFLNRIWAKFKDFTNRVILNDREYLERYKDIILNKEPPDIDLEMRDYAAGIHNMTSSMIPPFIQEQDGIPVDEADITLKSKLIPTYKDAGKDFSQFCVAYFQGGEDKKSTNLKNLNMTDLYNYCHDNKKIEDAIKKDQDTISNTFNSIQTEIQKAKTTEPQNNTDTSKKTGPNGEPLYNRDGKMYYKNANGIEITYTEAVCLYMEKYFNEADTPSSGMTIGATNKNTANNTTVTTGGVKASSNMKTVQTTNGQSNVKTDGVDLDTLDKKIKHYETVTSSILTAKMTSAHVIHKDYMKLIKLHVSHHTGKDSEDTVAKSGDDYRNALALPDTPDAILSKIDAIEKATDANQKSKLTQELNSSVIAKNPNFPGGIDIIKAAANKAKNANAK